MNRLLALAAALTLGLTACGTPVANVQPGSTPTTNAAEQVAAGLLGAYIAADTAYLGALTAGKVTKAQIAAIEPTRLAASAALDKFAAVSKTGNAVAEQAAAQTAINALIAALGANNIAVKKGN
jgi:hypothetical protein